MGLSVGVRDRDFLTQIAAFDPVDKESQNSRSQPTSNLPASKRQHDTHQASSGLAVERVRLVGCERLTMAGSPLRE